MKIPKNIILSGSFLLSLFGCTSSDNDQQIMAQAQYSDFETSTMLEKIRFQATGIEFGTKNQTNIFYVFFDPLDASVAKLWEEIQAYKDIAHFFWIPISTSGEKSFAVSGTIMSSPNRYEALDEHEKLIKKNSQTIQIDEASSQRMYSLIKNNSDLFMEISTNNKIHSNIFILHRNSNGLINVFDGIPDEKMVKLMLLE